MDTIKISDLKSKAKGRLSRSFGSALILLIVVGILEFAFVFFSKLISTPMNNSLYIEIFISILTLVYSPAIAFGLSFSIYQLYNASSVNPFAFLIIAFRYLIFSWKLIFRTFLEMIYESLFCIFSLFLLVLSASNNNLFLSIISGICMIIAIIFLTIKSYYFVFANYFFFDNTRISAKTALLKSKQLMLGGKRLKLFLLRLSFIPNYIIPIIIIQFMPTFSETIGLLVAFISLICFYLYMIWTYYYMQFSDIAFYKKLITENNKTSFKNHFNPISQYEMLEKAESNYNVETFDTDKNFETFDTTDNLETFDTLENFKENNNLDDK